jgi:hypothetical protein
MTLSISQLVGIPAFEAENVSCDRCPARATHRLGFTTGMLDFCTHHFNENEPDLLHRSTGMLIRAIEGGN